MKTTINEGLIVRIMRSPPLPSLPRVAMDVLALAEDPNVSLPALAKVVARDPALTARILRTVNSSVYHVAHRIGNLERALVVLGIEGVKTLVLGFSLVGNLKRVKSRGSFDHQAYWRRSLYAAAAAKILSEEFHVALQEEAFLASLLMDIGMLALDRVLGKEYGATVARANSHDALAAVETQALGITHAEVAGVLADRWKLPEALSIPMTHHHTPHLLEDSAIKEVAQIVWLAGRCADVFVEPKPEWSLSEVRRTCIERYRVSELVCGSILYRIGVRTQELAPLFEISLDGAPTYDTILKRASDGLVKLTRGIDAVAAGEEQRRVPRVSREGAIMVYPYQGNMAGAPQRAQFRDVSARGIGIALQHGLRLGDQFVVKLTRKPGEQVSVVYTVVRCERVGEKEFRIGAELTTVMRDATAAGVSLGNAEEDTASVDRIRRAVLTGE